MRHPFQRWPASRRQPALVCVTIAACLPLLLGTVVHPLHEDEPGGESIVAFELARTVDRADEILATWRAEDVIDEAQAIQVFDMVYPLIYASALAGLCLAAAGAWSRAGRPLLATAGVAMAWVAFAAAGLDYIENLGLDISLWDEPASPWPQVSFVAAVLKFAAIYSSLLYALTGVAGVLFERRARHRPAG